MQLPVHAVQLARDVTDLVLHDDRRAALHDEALQLLHGQLVHVRGALVQGEHLDPVEQRALHHVVPVLRREAREVLADAAVLQQLWAAEGVRHGAVGVVAGALCWLVLKIGKTNFQLKTLF